MKPHDGDSLKWVRITDGTDNILMVSRGGKAIQFSESDVRVMGRAAAGVRGMRVASGDSLIEGCVAGKDDKFVFTVSENGMGKISELTGMNAEQFLLYKKYLHSVHLIHTTNLSLTDITYHSNFADQSHFIKGFKQFTGDTPENFKRFL